VCPFHGFQFDTDGSCVGDPYSVHNFPRAEVTREVTTEGPHLRSAYSIDATLGVIGMPNRTVRVDFDVEVWGLGYSLVRLAVASFGVQGRLFVLPVLVRCNGLLGVGRVWSVVDRYFGRVSRRRWSHGTPSPAVLSHWQAQASGFRGPISSAE